MAAKKSLVLNNLGRMQQLQNNDWLEGLKKGEDVQEFDEALQDISGIQVDESSALIKGPDGGVEATPITDIITGGMVPLVIESNERYLIPSKKQAVAGSYITIEGSGILEIDGLLVML